MSTLQLHWLVRLTINKLPLSACDSCPEQTAAGDWTNHSSIRLCSSSRCDEALFTQVDTTLVNVQLGFFSTWCSIFLVAAMELRGLAMKEETCRNLS